MPTLQRLRRDHEAALLEFEQTNRAYFALSVTDRGDEFFDEFAERHRSLVAELAAGVDIFHVLVDEDGMIIGRFNLFGVADGTANVGYRVAERVSGRGVATAGLRSLCHLARDEYGLRMLRAGTNCENVASQRVLANAGFVAVGPGEVGGRHGIWFELVLAGEGAATI